MINFAPAASPAPEEGTISTNDTSGFAAGRFGRSSLRGGGGGFSTFVETGWNGAFTGDFSLASSPRSRSSPADAHGNQEATCIRIVVRPSWPSDCAPRPSPRNCRWETSIVLAAGGVTDGSGTAMQPLPIPNELSLESASIYSQALLLRPGSEQSSNALAISIGG